MAERPIPDQLAALGHGLATRPVLIAGPTASGKSALALDIADRFGGVIVNADASQVYDCWRVITARPSEEEENRAPHTLYGHVSARASYSVGHWLREVAPLLSGSQRPIIVGGTGLYFTALTQGLADIPEISEHVRERANAMTVAEMLPDLDETTLARIDINNRARVQRAWEVQFATGRSLANWQDNTGAPLLPISNTLPVVVDAPKDRLTPRIAQRFDQMIAAGALDEVAAVRGDYDPALPAHRAIGVPELMAHIAGQTSLDEAREAAIVATRQFAKRQRTWFRARMRDWHTISLR